MVVFLSGDVKFCEKLFLYGMLSCNSNIKLNFVNCNNWLNFGGKILIIKKWLSGFCKLLFVYYKDIEN